MPTKKYLIAVIGGYVKSFNKNTLVLSVFKKDAMKVDADKEYSLRQKIYSRYSIHTYLKNLR